MASSRGLPRLFDGSVDLGECCGRGFNDPSSVTMVRISVEDRRSCSKIEEKSRQFRSGTHERPGIEVWT